MEDEEEREVSKILGHLRDVIANEESWASIKAISRAKELIVGAIGLMLLVVVQFLHADPPPYYMPLMFMIVFLGISAWRTNIACNRINGIVDLFGKCRGCISK